MKGTDDRGLQGDAIIMDEANFVQGMSHELAMSYNLGETGLMNGLAHQVFQKGYGSLSSRPDYDGYITLAEANNWYRHGNGKELYADISKLDFTVKDFDNLKIGDKKGVNLLFDSKVWNDKLVYGNIEVTKINSTSVLSKYEDYDFDMHSWGSAKSAFRNVLTIMGSMVANFEFIYTGAPYTAPYPLYTPGKAFRIQFYGQKKVK